MILRPSPAFARNLVGSKPISFFVVKGSFVNTGSLRRVLISSYVGAESVPEEGSMERRLSTPHAKPYMDHSQSIIARIQGMSLITFALLKAILRGGQR